MSSAVEIFTGSETGMAQDRPLRPSLPQEAQDRLIVGLTGGIGSGKSTVAALFAKQGAGIIDTDAIAHNLTQTDGEAVAAIRSAFGKNYITDDGALDRVKMRGLIFSNGHGKYAAPDNETSHACSPHLGPSLRSPLPLAGEEANERLRKFHSNVSAKQRLEQILHPLIFEQARVQLRQLQAKPYILVVVPLLPESRTFRQLVQRVLVVDCAENIRIERVMGRSRMSEMEVRAIIARQATRAEMLRLSDDVICNDAEPDNLIEQVAALHESYAKIQNSN